MINSGNSVGIVDLFSGPGGLGEGFSAFKSAEGSSPFSIEVSIEKEASAHATLKLRSFLRKFPTGMPPEYYDFLNGDINEPNWAVLHPKQWAAAEHEVQCLELGQTRTAEVLAPRIDAIRKKFGGRTVLIGGPPCQAYSLVGRSRNAGNAEYIPHKDKRNFLYQQYVNVLKQLQPAVFVMENVKGMLSSAVKGGKIFQKVMSDLQAALGPGSYKLLALSPLSDLNLEPWSPDPKDFIVRAEEFGVPQARHRVIIVGLRSDVAANISSESMPSLKRYGQTVSVLDVIGQMPTLRSGLSRNDGLDNWRDAFLQALEMSEKSSQSLPKRERAIYNRVLGECRETLINRRRLFRAGESGANIPQKCPTKLKAWLSDPNVYRLPNNETRGHMPSDLGRYLFAAAFGEAHGRSPKAAEFPDALAPNHRNWNSGSFSDRFRVQIGTRPASTITSHISKDGHYFIHPDAAQCRSLTVREAARVQTFPDNYYFKGNRTQQYVQVGNAVPPFLALQIASSLWEVFE